MFKKLLLALTTIAAARVHAAVFPVPQSGAANTCDSWALVPNSATLTANCQDNTGNFVPTSILISNCVANNEGTLSCRQAGGAGGTCDFFDVEGQSNGSKGTFTISAHCKRTSGETVTVNHFNMDDCFTNNNGVVGC